MGQELSDLVELSVCVAGRDGWMEGREGGREGRVWHKYSAFLRRW